MAESRRRPDGWVIGHAFGAPVVFQWASLITMALIAFVVSQRGGTVVGGPYARGAILVAVLLASVLVHELAHALAARSFGRDVKEIVLTAMGGHTTFDARNMTPLVSGVTALAGPATNALVGVAALALVPAATTSTMIYLAGLVGSINVILAIFNVLPGIPMDGGRVLEALVWGVTGRQRWGTIVAAWGGRVVVVGFAVYVVATNFGGGRTPSTFSLAWGFLLITMLWPASTQALRGVRAQRLVESVTVDRLMRRAIGVRFDASVATAVREAERAGADEVVVLGADGTPAGHFAVSTASSVPEDRRISTRLDAVTVPLPRGAAIGMTIPGPQALETIREWWDKTDALVVIDDGEVVGLVRLAEVAQRLK